ncbi:MAG TPA: S8 family serine peptidase [Clostridia bacterium]|nr:S8 family serine peptidase [Clostridia bacterium]
MRLAGIPSRLVVSSAVAIALIVGTLSPCGSAGVKRAEAAQPVPRFWDVEGHWAERDIYHLASKRLVSGRDEGFFFPEKPVTRAEFAKLLVGGLGLNSAAQEIAASPYVRSYRDVPDTHWARGYITLSAELGLVSGYPDNTFRPEEYVTRAEIAAMLMRAVYYGMGKSPDSMRSGGGSQERGAGGEATAGSGLDAPAVPFASPLLASRFKDATSIPEWAEDSVSFAFGRGLMRGYPDGTFRPNEYTKRAEAAAIIRRILVLFGNDYDYSGVVVKVSGSVPKKSSSSPPGVRGPGDAGSAGNVNGAPNVVPNAENAVSGVADTDTGEAVLEIRPYAAIGVGEVGVFEPAVPGRTLPSGDVTKADPAGKAAVGVVKVKLSNDALIYRESKRSNPREIKPFDEVFIVFGQNQRAIFVDVEPAEEFAPGSQDVRATGSRSVDSWVSGLHTRSDGSHVKVAAAGQVPRSIVYDSSGFDINTSAISVPSFVARTGATGRGAVIAIVDTGIDVTHPDLRFGPQGEHKIIDWKDFSGEGFVSTRESVIAPLGGGSVGAFGQRVGFGEKVMTEAGEVWIGPIATKSKSGQLRYGFLRETDIDRDSPCGGDLDKNGTSFDSFFVLLVDTEKRGRYDTVFVDTDHDWDLRDEVGMKPYKVSGDVGYFGGAPRSPGAKTGVPFVVSEINESGRWVTLGFDGNGHGTHVAGIAAAYRPGVPGANEGMRGIAPGAAIMCLKAMDSCGRGSWENIARALEYAAQNGADVISVSIGGSLDRSGSFTAESQMIQELARKYGVTFVISAGNEGPGLGSASAPGGAYGSITVGGYMSPSMWKHYYGYVVPKEGLWPYSGVGPRADGGFLPDVLGPACATSCVPLWLNESGYETFEGTSMAAPHVAGALALLLETPAAAKLNSRERAEAVRRALLMGSRPIQGLTPTEQGHGLVDVNRAYNELTRFERVSEMRVVAEVGGGFQDGGIFVKDETPGRIEYYIANLSPRPYRLEFGGLPPWIRMFQSVLTVLPVRERTLPIDYCPSREPGFYSAVVEGDDPESYGTEVEILQTLVVPEKLDESNIWSTAHNDNLAPAAFRRYFVEVPPFGSDLFVSLRSSIGRDGSSAGRVAMMIYAPGGRIAYSGGFVGRMEPLLPVEGVRSVTPQGDMDVKVFQDPEPGVWEIVVLSDPACSLYGLSSSDYQLRVRLQGNFAKPSGLDVFVGAGEGPQTERDIEIINMSGEKNVRIEGVGLSPSRSVVSQILEVDAEEAGVGEIGVVKEGARWLFVKACEPGSTGADLDIFLYRYDEASAGWKEVAASARRGVPCEEIWVKDPLPGKYVAYVETSDIRSGAVTCKFSSEVIYQHDMISVKPEILLDIPAKGKALTGQLPESLDVLPIKEGERLRFKVKISLPQEEGVYYGYVILEDADKGEVLAAIPVTVTRSDARFSVTVRPLVGAMPSGDVPGPDPVPVLITVRKIPSLEAVDARVRLDGLWYHARYGRVKVFVFGPLPREVSILVKSDGLGYFEGRFKLESMGDNKGMAERNSGNPGELVMVFKAEVFATFMFAAFMEEESEDASEATD